MKFTSKHACLGLAEIDRTIVEALRYALEELFPEMMQTYHITERNGYGQYKWNFIIAQLKAVCSHLGWIDMDSVKEPRGNYRCYFTKKHEF